MMTPVSPDDLECLVSPARFNTFVKLASGDRKLAASLYTWTGEVAGALFTDFRILEVAIRNLIDRALARHVAEVAPHVSKWPWDSSWLPVGGHWWDSGARKTLTNARRHAGGLNAPHGAIVAQLPFRLLALHARGAIRGVLLEYGTRRSVHRIARPRPGRPTQLP